MADAGKRVEDGAELERERKLRETSSQEVGAAGSDSGVGAHMTEIVHQSEGEPIGMTWRIFQGTKLIAVDQQTSPLRIDCTITARIRFPRGGVKKGQTYTATFALNDINGTVLNRRLTIRSK